MDLESTLILHQALKGLALNREPGWNYPGNFLDVSFDEVGPASARLSLQPGPHCVDADGQTSFAALCLLADVGLASSTRHALGVDTRMATVSMALLFTGAPRTGRLEVTGQLAGLIENVVAPQGIARAEVRAGGALVCTAVGTFITLGPRPGLSPLPARRRDRSAEVPALSVAELDPDERAIYARAEAALQGGAPGFVERFWGLAPQRTAQGAASRLVNGAHVGNRVGHTQGGITFALAATTASVALDEGWQLTGCSSSYLAPGTGAALHAEARFVHRGRLTAVLRTEIRDDAGRIVLDTVTQHAKVLA